MACSEPPQFCLGDHIMPRLDGAAVNGGRPHQYAARCPAHTDRRRSLSIGIGDRSRVVWRCYAGCTQADVRAALVRQGVPDSCLPRAAGQRTEDELVSLLIKIIESEPPGARRDLLIAAAARNRGRMPRGRDLEELARWAGRSKAAAYRATETDRQPTGGTRGGASPNHSGLHPV